MFDLADSPQIQLLRSLTVSFVVFPVMAALHVLSPAEVSRNAPPCKHWRTTISADDVFAAEARNFDATNTGTAVGEAGAVTLTQSRKLGRWGNLKPRDASI